MILYAFIVSCLLVQTFSLNVEKFLSNYNYMNPLGYSSNSVQDGILKFQEVFHLNKTGLLDPATIKLMETPRCGMADNVQAMSSSNDLFYGGKKWGKSHLTYKIINTGNDLPADTVYRIMQQSFQMWSNVSALTFSRVQHRATADLKILFGSRNHGDPWHFDGPGGILAHAYYPRQGHVHFDMDETFTDRTYKGSNLLYIAVHEIGHALGLRHSNIRNSVMFPAYTGYRPGFQLHSNEVESLRRVYGKKTENKPTPTSSTTTSTSTKLPTGGCKDRYTTCSTIYKNKCDSGKFPRWQDWRMRNCRYTCGICKTGMKSCHDKNSNKDCDR